MIKTQKIVKAAFGEEAEWQCRFCRGSKVIKTQKFWQQLLAKRQNGSADFAEAVK